MAAQTHCHEVSSTFSQSYLKNLLLAASVSMNSGPSDNLSPDSRIFDVRLK